MVILKTLMSQGRLGTLSSRVMIMHQGRSIGWQAVIDGNTADGRFYHDGKTDSYAADLAARVAQFLELDWQEIAGEPPSVQ